MCHSHGRVASMQFRKQMGEKNQPQPPEPPQSNTSHRKKEVISNGASGRQVLPLTMQRGGEEESLCPKPQVMAHNLGHMTPRSHDT